MFEDAHDNMVFTDPETGDQLIFHRKTWLCTIHGILTVTLALPLNWHMT